MVSILLALSLSSDAHAGIYGGNPTLKLEVDRPAGDVLSADVTLKKVRVSYCGGGYTDYTVDGAVELVAGHSMVVSGGDICVVRAYWDTEMDIEGTAYLLEYSAAYTDVQVTTSGPQPASLVPFTVVSGSIYGQGPQLFVSFN